MDLKELKSFQAIIEEGTFTKAALKLNYAQSTITNHIKKLEEELEITLFLEGKSNQLTPEGEVFKQEIQSLISHWETTKGQLLDVSKKIKTIIKLGFVQPYDRLALPKIIHSFTKKYPNVQVQIVVGSTFELSNALKQNKIDFALCSLPHDDTFIYEELFKEEICFVTSQNSTLIINKLSDLEGTHIYRSGNGCPFRRKIETYLDSCVSNIHWEFISNITTIPYLIEINNYCSLLPKSVISNTQADIKSIPIPLPDNHMTMGILSIQNPSLLPNVKKQLIQEIKSYFSIYKIVDHLS